MVLMPQGFSMGYDAVIVTLMPHVVALVQEPDLLLITLFLATILERQLAQVSVVSEHLHNEVLCFHSSHDVLFFHHSLDNDHHHDGMDVGCDWCGWKFAVCGGVIVDHPHFPLLPDGAHP